MPSARRIVHHTTWQIKVLIACPVHLVAQLGDGSVVTQHLSTSFANLASLVSGARGGGVAGVMLWWFWVGDDAAVPVL